MDTSIIEIAERIKGLRELSDYTPEEVAEAEPVDELGYRVAVDICEAYAVFPIKK